MKNIFEYLDYKLYLRELFEEKKRESPNFSHRSLMQKLSLRAPGHILFIIQGKRRLTQDIALRLANYLKLGKKETDYLLALVQYTNAKTPSEKQYSFEEILTLRMRTSAKVPVSGYRFYEKWYYGAIRASLDVEQFSGDYAHVAASLCPPITPAEAKQAIELLLEIGMAIQDETGTVRPVEASISTGDAWQSATISHLQRQFIELAKESIDRVGKKDRDISNLTVTVSEETFEVIKKKVRDFRSQIMAMACAEQSPDRVLQVNIQLFPLQKKSKGLQK
jgi:uncharacterized protein (TIGR02147 family)